MSHRRSVPASGLAPVGLALAVVCTLVFIGAAQASSVLNVRDEGHLRFVHASGSVIIDEGRVSGSFPGSAKVRFLYDGEPDVSARFTITGGTGRYAHIHGSGELFGVYYRRSYGLTVQAIGKLPY